MLRTARTPWISYVAFFFLTLNTRWRSFDFHALRSYVYFNRLYKLRCMMYCQGYTYTSPLVFSLSLPPTQAVQPLLFVSLIWSAGSAHKLSLLSAHCSKWPFHMGGWEVLSGLPVASLDIYSRLLSLYSSRHPPRSRKWECFMTGPLSLFSVVGRRCMACVLTMARVTDSRAEGCSERAHLDELKLASNQRFSSFKAAFCIRNSGPALFSLLMRFKISLRYPDL